MKLNKLTAIVAISTMLVITGCQSTSDNVTEVKNESSLYVNSGSVINTESGVELNIDINSIRYYDENKQLRMDVSARNDLFEQVRVYIDNIKVDGDTNNVSDTSIDFVLGSAYVVDGVDNVFNAETRAINLVGTYSAIPKNIEFTVVIEDVNNEDKKIISEVCKIDLENKLYTVANVDEEQTTFNNSEAFDYINTKVSEKMDADTEYNIIGTDIVGYMALGKSDMIYEYNVAEALDKLDIKSDYYTVHMEVSNDTLEDSIAKDKAEIDAISDYESEKSSSGDNYSIQCKRINSRTTLVYCSVENDGITYKIYMELFDNDDETDYNIINNALNTYTQLRNAEYIDYISLN